MKQLADTKNSYEDEQKQFKQQMTEMSELIENTLDDIDFDALEENMENLSDEHTKASRKEDELDEKIRDTVTNMLTRKRTTLGEQYTVRDRDFFYYGASGSVAKRKTHKVLNRLNKEHFNGDKKRWNAFKKIRDEYEEYREKWASERFKQEKELDVDEPEDHVLDISSNKKERIKDVEKVKISGGRYSKVYFRGKGRGKETVNITGTYVSDTYTFKEVYLLACARKEIHEMQKKQMRDILEYQQDLKNHLEAVKKHGKSFNVANKLSGI